MTMKQSKTEILHIYHTNDIHSHFENWPGISEFLLQKRTAHEQANESCFVFDIGDFVDRSNLFTEATSGKGNTELLNHAQYDAVTIGNNEGITLSKEALTSLYKDAQFDVILGNLKEANGEQLDWAVPYKTYVTEYGTRVSVIAATAVYETFYKKLGWTILKPRRVLERLAAELRKTSDCIICLSHLGIHEDRMLAEETSDIDVILGAHTHHLFVQGEWMDGTMLAATGKFGEYIGYVNISIEKGETKKIQASVIPAKELKESLIEEQILSDKTEEAIQLLDNEVFYTPIDLKRNLVDDSELSTFFGEALLSYTNADCALFNTGIFLEDLPKGVVTKKDLHKVLPHPINACILMISGSALYDYYETSLDPEWIHKEVRGLGFRGTVMGSMIQTNLSMSDEGILYVGQLPVEESSTYRLATLDMFTFGFFYPDMQSEIIDYIVPEMIRDIAGWYGAYHYGMSINLT